MSYSITVNGHCNTDAENAKVEELTREFVRALPGASFASVTLPGKALDLRELRDNPATQTVPGGPDALTDTNPVSEPTT